MRHMCIFREHLQQQIHIFLGSKKLHRSVLHCCLSFLLLLEAVFSPLVWYHSPVQPIHLSLRRVMGGGNEMELSSTQTNECDNGSADGETPKTNDGPVSFNFPSMALPAAMYSVVERLDDLSSDALSNNQRLAILFVIRLGDAMHQAGYATFLTASYVAEIAMALDVPGLTVDIEYKALRWSYYGKSTSPGNTTSLEAIHRVATDFDGDAIFELGTIARAAAKNRITAEQGLHMIHQCTGTAAEKKRPLLVKCYRGYPGRILILALLTATSAPLFFQGTAIDSAFGLLTGSTVGLTIYVANYVLPEIADMHEGLLSVVVSMIAAGAYAAAPNQSCFTGHVLAALIWLLYGISFTIALYEMTVSSGALLVTGTARFGAAILNSFILAMGVVVGLWAAGIYAGPDRFENVLNQDCSTLEGTFSNFWLFVFWPILGISIFCMMRISPRHWLPCLLVLLVGLGSNYLLDVVLEQPSLMVNIVPVYLSTVTAHYAVVFFHRLHMGDLKISKNAYRIAHRNMTQKDENNAYFSSANDRTSIDPCNDGSDVPSQGLRQRSTLRRQLGMRQIQFVDRGWSRMDAGGMISGAGGGYIRNTKNQYQHADLWFCLMPTIFALVPGSSVWRVAFFAILQSTWTNDYSDQTLTSTASDLLSGVLIVGLSQVVGIRMGITTLALMDRFFARGSKSKQERRSLDRESVGETGVHLEKDSERESGSEEQV